MRRRLLYALFFSRVLMLLGCAHHEPPVNALPASQPQEAVRLYDQGLALARAGDLTRAEQYLASAQRLGHDEQASTRALVSVCVRASRLRSALSYAEAHLVAHPGDHALRKLSGTLYWALGEPAAAERALTRALSVAPDDADAHFLLGVVLGAHGARAGEAAEHYARYLALSPTGKHAEEAREALRERPVQPTRTPVPRKRVRS
jgi:predicted Zn-dependent protease